MRCTLLALLAFVTGVALALHLPQAHRARVPLPVAMAAPPAATSHSAANQDSDEPLPATADAPSNWPVDGPTPEQVIYDQPHRLAHSLHQLGPREPGRPNLWMIGFAGDGTEDVFHNEVEYAAELFTRRFGHATHALILENHPNTLQKRPLADWSNLEAVLDALQTRMDPSQDILMLYLSTHGDQQHTLLVDMDPLPLDQIGPKDLAGLLAEYPFKWKVVVVNACYSGGFVPALQGPGTLVLTAARGDRSSFGCGSDSEMTYFGRAWLRDGLNRSSDFIQAFRQAQTEIAAWEKADKLTPSEPQIDIGAGIETQLQRWAQGFKAGPAVPFVPAIPAANDHSVQVR